MLESEIENHIRDEERTLEEQGLGYLIYTAFCPARRDGDTGCVCRLNELRRELTKVTNG